MTDKSIIIIGAGIAGLSAGCYGQMNGYRTQIFEMHNLPGGLCTSWKRKGYTIDGCIHHLAGSSPKSKIYSVWEELGAVQGREMVFRDHFVRVEDPTMGKAFTVYTDLDRLEQHLRELAPDDRTVIDEYMRALRLLTGMDLLALQMATPVDMLRTLRFVPAMMKWGKITMAEFGARFSEPFLRRAFPLVQYDFADIPMLIHLNFIASCYNHTMGWPTGGSLAFSQGIEQRYRELGGEIHYRSRVEKILVENDRAVGVRLADGSEHRADVVISAADGHTTIFGMLDGRYIDDRIKAYYADVPDRQEMNFHIAFGVARDMSQEPHALTYFLERPVTILGKERDRLDVEIFNFDPTMAPAGKCVVKILMDASYERWKALRDDRERYQAEKQRVAEQIMDQLEHRFPGLKEQAEVVDVATPVTVEHYTGNWRGAQAWLAPDAGVMEPLMGRSSSLPGLENFHMVGQWASTIGISTAAIGGRKLIKKICKRDGRRFSTSVP